MPCLAEPGPDYVCLSPLCPRSRPAMADEAVRGGPAATGGGVGEPSPPERATPAPPPRHRGYRVSVVADGADPWACPPMRCMRHGKWRRAAFLVLGPQGEVHCSPPYTCQEDPVAALGKPAVDVPGDSRLAAAPGPQPRLPALQAPHGQHAVAAVGGAAGGPEPPGEAAGSVGGPEAGRARGGPDP